MSTSAAQADLRDLSEFVVEPASVRLLGERFCRKKHVVVLGDAHRDVSEAVQVGMQTPNDLALVETIGQFLGRQIAPVHLALSDIQTALGRAFGGEAPGEAAPQPDARLVFDDATGDTEHPLQMVLEGIITNAQARGATAVHIDPSPQGVRVRARVDGVLQLLRTPLDPANIGGFVARVRALAGLGPAVASPERATVHARFGDGIDAPPLRIDVATLPGPAGTSLTLRVSVPPHEHDLDLGQLGLTAAQRARIDTLLGSLAGTLVVSGLPGSGRSLTLSACVHARASTQRKTLVVDGWGAPWPDDVRALRADTDTASTLVAELADYDADTVALDLPAADTAMLGLLGQTEGAPFRLFTRTASGPANTLDRLRHAGASGFDIADRVSAVLHQWKLRRCCNGCRTQAANAVLDSKIAERLGRPLSHFSVTGCEACSGTGYRGTLAVFELLEVDATTAPLLARGDSGTAVRCHALARGMVDAFSAGLEHVQSGLTTLAELERALPPRIVGQWLAAPG